MRLMPHSKFELMKIMNQDCGSKEGKIEERLPQQNGKFSWGIKKKARTF